MSAIISSRLFLPELSSFSVTGSHKDTFVGIHVLEQLSIFKKFEIGLKLVLS